MSARLARQFESDPLAAPVAPDVHALVALAVKVTARPQEVTAEDIQATLSAAHSPRQYFDAVGVMVAFNFITRVANALGVEPEIPGWMRRFEPLRQLGLKALGLFFRLFVDLTPKAVHGPQPAEHLQSFQTLFADLRLGEVPSWIERLSVAPPLLAALREFFEALVRRDAKTGAISLDVNRFMAIGRTVLPSIPNAVTLRTLIDNWQPATGADIDDPSTAVVTQFAKDVALRSYTLTPERVEELRAAGLGDADILDIVVTAGLWSAAARLEVLTSCLPAMAPSEIDAEPDAIVSPVLSVQAST
jgi:alkylhydroperoxidase family enzyme